MVRLVEVNCRCRSAGAGDGVLFGKVGFKRG